MKRFSKLALVLGFMGVFALQSYSAQAATTTEDVRLDFKAVPEQIGTLMSRYFKDDKSSSPLSETDSGRLLVNRVARYMRKGMGDMLHLLFYQPDANVWSALYQQVRPGQEFSALNLVTFLDKTKTQIFDAYRSIKSPVDGEAYLYIPTLFDKAMQQIFTGCWGFSNEPTPDGIIDQLKGIYGRVVSDLVHVSGQDIELHRKELEVKQNEFADVRIKAHFTTLQECAAAVHYQKKLMDDGWRGKPSTTPIDITSFLTSCQNPHEVSPSRDSFEKTLSVVKYQNSLDGMCCYDQNVRGVANHLLHISEDAKLNTSKASKNLRDIALTIKFGLGLLSFSDEQIKNINDELLYDPETTADEKNEIYNRSRQRRIIPDTSDPEESESEEQKEAVDKIIYDPETTADEKMKRLQHLRYLMQIARTKMSGSGAPVKVLGFVDVAAPQSHIHQEAVPALSADTHVDDKAGSEQILVAL